MLFIYTSYVLYIYMYIHFVYTYNRHPVSILCLTFIVKYEKVFPFKNDFSFFFLFFITDNEVSLSTICFVTKFPWMSLVFFFGWWCCCCVVYNKKYNKPLMDDETKNKNPFKHNFKFSLLPSSNYSILNGIEMMMWSFVIYVILMPLCV